MSGETILGGALLLYGLISILMWFKARRAIATRTCATCRHYWPRRVSRDDDYCRRFPPHEYIGLTSPIEDDPGPELWLHPEVDPDHCCGEWGRR